MFVHLRGLFSGHAICVRPAGRLTDADLLARLGRGHYRLADDPRWLDGKLAVLAEVGDWTVIVDDLLYSLWNDPQTRGRVDALAAKVDVFVGFDGECDDSFGFRYFRDGKRVRDVLAYAPGEQIDDVGEPLPEEAGGGDPVRRVAAGLGLVNGPPAGPVRVYRP